jgi:hypothetical protein
MAGPQTILPVSYEAGEDLSSSQYRAVVVGASDGLIALPAGANASRFQGILQDRPVAGESGEVMKLGISRAIAVGTIANGDPLEIGDAAGGVKSLTSGVGSYLGTAENLHLALAVPVQHRGR